MRKLLIRILIVLLFVGVIGLFVYNYLSRRILYSVRIMVLSFLRTRMMRTAFTRWMQTAAISKSSATIRSCT